MNIAEFKIITAALNGDTPVYVSDFKKEYILKHPEQLTHCSVGQLGDIVCLWDVTFTAKLSEFRNLPDSTELSVDVEDGFVFRDAEEIIVSDGRVIIFAEDRV